MSNTPEKQAKKEEVKQEPEQFEALLQYLAANEDKLKILLSGEQNLKPLLYPIKGKRATKTVFIAEKLQCLINEYCIDKELKIGDLVECAVIQYLNQNGYAEKLEAILKCGETIES